MTAGPGVTNALSPITQAYFAGAPLVVVGGRAPQANWGRAPSRTRPAADLRDGTKRSATAVDAETGPAVADAFALAGAAHRGPVFLDVPMDELFKIGTRPPATPTAPERAPFDTEAIARIAALLHAAARPVLILGTDVWADGAERAALELVEGLGLPVITNGMARGVIPGGHPLLATKARRTALKVCDLVVVVGTPLDFRLGYGSFGPTGARAQVVHLADTPSQISAHATLADSVSGDLAAMLRALGEATTPGDWTEWVGRLRAEVGAAIVTDQELLQADNDPIHPARIYGELLPRLTPEAVVIGDGGDFVSWAGRFIEPARPGGWLDPGPFGCLGAGLGAAIGAKVARPDDPVVLLLGDGAAGMSLMDVDTLVRHNLPVVMVVGNNSAWGLEKHPMRMIYGYDVITNLAPETRYARSSAPSVALGEEETPGDICPAIDWPDAGVPTDNVMIDIEQHAAPRLAFCRLRGAFLGELVRLSERSSAAT